MSTRTSRRILAAALALISTVAIAGCGSSSDPLAGDSASSSAAADSIVVGSANFPENELLADIYAGALTHQGMKASTKLDIASRETYIPALKKGEINLIPEYTGNLARYFDKSASISDPKTAEASLRKALPTGLTALAPAPAQNKDSMVVTRATAQQKKLKSISDLSSSASGMVLGAPPEFKTRVDGVTGLKREYGLTFKQFKPLDEAGPLTVQALKNGQVQVANLFSTDPNIAANDFVVLNDPKNLFGAQNIVPVMTASKASPKATKALDAVSAKLTTPVVQKLVEKVVIDKQDASTVAQDWLKANGLG
ncbi:ABC transporter substrate-binding protein [Acidipropionibacterium virtanenii]|uniref:Glycine betaine-binding protein YehZ n=1 Tax=Acidipropionibacterium virtanenii TaxID=2057246 RepID=A0A344UQT0_9ACTN|nr:ABC transporter substrate-binding protein [Acidipropionibacterium virtanenii]AXE37628.1 Glycine betaine-binding protein YehZ [Acidipropionibacterium virtanenii]